MHMYSHIPTKRTSNLCLAFPAWWRKEASNCFYSPCTDHRTEGGKVASMIMQCYTVVSSLPGKFPWKTRYDWFVHLKWHKHLEQIQNSRSIEYIYMLLYMIVGCVNSVCVCVYVCVCMHVFAFNAWAQILFFLSSHINQNKHGKVKAHATFHHSLCIYMCLLKNTVHLSLQIERVWKSAQLGELFVHCGSLYCCLP